MMDSANKGVHDGHRKNIKKKFITNGLDVFEPHEALELYLYYAIPRRDTNPLAHRLLDRYMTISGVCDAPIDELMRDFGLSENAAVLLKLLPEMSRLYNESKFDTAHPLDYDKVQEMIKTKFIGRTEEVVVLLLVDVKCKILFFDVISKGSINSTDVPIRKIVDLALRHNANLAFLAHNHPSGLAFPSNADINTTNILYNTLKSVGITLVDHYIVSDNEVVPVMNTVIK